MLYETWLILCLATLGFYAYEIAKLLHDENTMEFLDGVIFVCCFPCLVILAVTSADLDFVSAGTIVYYHLDYWLYIVFWGLSLTDIAFIIVSFLAVAQKLPSQFKFKVYDTDDVN